MAAGQFLQLRQRGHIQCRQAVIVAVKQLQAGNLSQVQGGELVFIAQQSGQPRKLLQGQRSQFIADAVQIGKPGKAADALQRGNAFAADIQAGHRVTFRRGQNPVAVGIQLADAFQKGGVRKMSAVQRHPGIGRGRRRGRHIQRCRQGGFRGGGLQGCLHDRGRVFLPDTWNTGIEAAIRATANRQAVTLRTGAKAPVRRSVSFCGVWFFISRFTSFPKVLKAQTAESAVWQNLCSQYSLFAV